ncbi:MAG: arginine--tRNA ligase [Patescibacteria group bacterium]|nr:arginine--tRNA ligase [Patescibacteria group bacterium]
MSTLDKIKQNIADSINAALKQQIVQSADLVYPPKPEFGDISLPCYNLAKSFKKSPVEMAEFLVGEVALGGTISGTKAIGPFINFTFNKQTLAQGVLSEIALAKNQYGLNDSGGGQKIMVEFAHPNTHKAFHIGHLRNILTGEAVSRILQANGYKIIRANYQGDIGLHIAKCLWGIGQLATEYKEMVGQGVKAKAEFLGRAYALGSKFYEEDEQIKKEIVELNKKIYSQDKSVKRLYQTTRKWSLDYFGGIYKRLNTKFDRLYFESEVFQRGREVVLENLEKQIFKKSDGAVIFEGEKYGLHTRVFINSEGNPTYEAKDMGLAKLQFAEFNPAKIIHLVGPEQVEYFKVIIKALELILPETKGRERHLPYGWVRLKAGKMSSRLGNVVLGEWLLDEAKTEILKIMKGKRSLKNKDEVAEKIALAAVKYSILKSGINTDIAFSLEESISFSGMSGPYLQYTCARIGSIMKKANPKPQTSSAKQIPSLKPQKITYNNLTEPKENGIVNKLARYPEMVRLAAENYDPSELAKYLFELAQGFNDYYHAVPVLKAKTEIKQARLALIMAVKQTLANGLELLGIETVEEM